MTPVVVTAAEAARFDRLRAEVAAANEPAFLDGDAAVAAHWPRLAADFPDYQFCLLGADDGQPAGAGYSVPLAFDGDGPDLPDGGLDWALAKAFDDRARGRAPNLVSALYILVADTHRGRGWSTKMLAAMKTIAARQGFSDLIAPVRPSRKALYPLISIADYCRWRTPDGAVFDPWLRVHCRAGGEVVRPCLESMTVRAPIDQWTAWTGLHFPGPGDHVVPGGLTPLRVTEAGDGVYREPGIWVRHDLNRA